jgi:hypothetical protein
MAGSLWAAVTAGGAWLAKRTPTRRSEEEPSSPKTWLIGLAAFVFLVGLLTAVSFGTTAIVAYVSELIWPHAQVLWPHDPDQEAQTVMAGFASATSAVSQANPAGAAVAGSMLNDRNPADFLTRALAYPLANLVILFICLVLLLIFNLAIPANRYSLHSLYANRLIRCYLGASRYKSTWADRKSAAPVSWKEGPGGAPTRVPDTDERRANRFTDFDPKDDLPLTDLQIVRRPEAATTPDHSYFGPLHLINTAMNLVAGTDLATQDRKAAAFVLTPDYCGSDLTGYVALQPPEADPLTLGRALTISGAAVDPNMNVLQSGATTALLTLLNARLGWWLANPKKTATKKGWSAGEPAFGGQMYAELLGWTNEKRDFVHLTDGGHFENLGVYELIRRRCRYVVVVDAGTDRVAASDNMAAMLQLVRTDFGISIELDTSVLQLVTTTGYSPWHVAVGRIRYDEVDDQAVPGTIFYLQATLTGDEPPDLLQYHARNPAFPRQSTLDQFFDDTQFECYRALGHHVATQVFGIAAEHWGKEPSNADIHQKKVRDLFSEVRRQWFPPLPCSQSEWLTAAQAAMSLEQNLSAADRLAPFSLATYPEIDRKVPAFGTFGSPTVRCVQDDELVELRAVSQTLQVMEIAWYGVKLNEFHAHPMNRGWMNTFRRWTAPAVFRRYWPVLRAEYSAPFVRFCEQSLNLQPTRADYKRYQNADAGLLKALGEEFLQEWGDELPAAQPYFPSHKADPFSAMADYAATDVQKFGPSGAAPFVWLLNQVGGTAGPPLQDLPCGFACVWRPRDPNAGQPQCDANFFVWLRGAYRTMGIGTDIVPRIIDDEVIPELLGYPLKAGASPLRRLTAYYPLAQRGAGSRLEQSRWMNFFFGQRFRRFRQPKTGPESDLLVLKRELY